MTTPPDNDTEIDKLLEQIYTLASGNESLLKLKVRTMEEWFAHREGDILVAKAALQALIAKRENLARIDELSNHVAEWLVINNETFDAIKERLAELQSNLSEDSDE